MRWPIDSTRQVVSSSRRRVLCHGILDLVQEMPDLVEETAGLLQEVPDLVEETAGLVEEMADLVEETPTGVPRDPSSP
ncbi:MAG: hypothetical protein ACLQVI_25975 [Polyangiaceae bacterium]|jgi:hypothetical protein